MKKVLSYMKAKEWILLILFVTFVCIQVKLSLEIPEYMANITTTMQKSDGNFKMLLKPSAFMLVFALLSIISAFIASYCLAKMSSKVIMLMREEIFEKIISFNLPEMNGNSTSSLITRCTNDIAQLQNFAGMGLSILVQAPVTVVIAVSKMGTNKTWLFATCVVTIILTIISCTLFGFSVSKTSKVQKLIDSINRITKEHLTGMRVVHAYNGYKFQKKQFDGVNNDLTKNNISANRLMGAVSPFFNLSINALSFIIIFLGGMMIHDASNLSDKQEIFSQMVVFSSYALQAISAFALMIVVFAALPRTIVSLRRVNEVIDTNISIEDGMAESSANGEIGTLEFRDVSFAYPGCDVNALSNISFKVQRGQTLAIIGSTGSGKTTLMNLIPRFYDVSSGSIFLDGRDIRNYKLWALRDKIGYVPQKSFLFSGTVNTNIDFGQKSGFEATLSDIKKAAEVGQSKDFIEQKKGMYDAEVHEGGVNFSGGQRQRLTISRAVCRDPEFYLFDDSFSALDFKTDATLRKKLRENAKNATQIIVGQRIGSIMNADIIIVLDKGRVVGMGKHKELLDSCEVYREIALSQLMPEEVS